MHATFWNQFLLAGPLALLVGAGAVAMQPSIARAQTIKQSGAAGGGEYPHSIEQVPWFKNPDVLAHIKLNNTQVRSLYDDYDRYRTRYDERLRQLDRDLAEQERLQRQAELYDEFQQDFTKSLDSVITDRIARRRYEELYRQYQGYSAFHNPALRKQLNLTSEQYHQLRALDQEWNDEVARIREEFSKNRPVAMRQLKHARRQMHDRIVEALEPEQQATWRELTGDRYDFPAQVYLPQAPEPAVDVAEPPVARQE